MWGGGMSGKIELTVRKSKPKRKDLNYYPGWVWEITGEDGKQTTIMPSWNDIENVLIATIKHEMKVDISTNRNPDRARYMKFLKDMITKLTKLQTEYIDFHLEKIYIEARKNDRI